MSNAQKYIKGVIIQYGVHVHTICMFISLSNVCLDENLYLKLFTCSACVSGAVVKKASPDSTEISFFLIIMLICRNLILTHGSVFIEL